MPSSDELLFPAIEPFQHGLLPTTPPHHIYYEQCGNPVGIPVVVLHGGPGSGCTPTQRRFFDPSIYRIILFDQRGCKRSLPVGCTEDNSTSSLILDIEALRNALGIERWMVFGGSWGSTLALSYALEHPTSVSELILRGIFLSRPHELKWFLYDVRNFFPEAWEKLTSPLASEERKDIFQAYWKRVFSPDSSLALKAAETWSNFESEIMSLIPAAPQTSDQAKDPLQIIGRARVQMHYLAHHGFINGDDVLGKLDIIRHIPAKIIQGRYDMVCPPSTAYELHQKWPEAEFILVPDAGHSAMEPGIISALMEAANHFHPSSNVSI